MSSMGSSATKNDAHRNAAAMGVLICVSGKTSRQWGCPAESDFTVNSQATGMLSKNQTLPTTAEVLCIASSVAVAGQQMG